MLKQRIKAVIGQDFVNRFKFRRTKLLERLNIYNYSYPALFGMDKALIEKFNKRNGTFIEVGANDGFAQSNTYALERFYGWRGILIEPIPELYQMCKQFRPNATVYNCALGPAEDGAFEKTSWIRIKNDYLDSKVITGHSDDTNIVTVPMVTLSSLIDKSDLPIIDFFSLDVEGYELGVLGGLDMHRHRPTYILVETSQPDRVNEFLSLFYKLETKISHHDYLFRSTYSNP